MRLSLRGTVIATFVLVTALCALLGGLAIFTAVRSAQQITALERNGLAPTVALSILSQNIDQERALLAEGHARLTTNAARAIADELTSLDLSIAAAGPRALEMATLPVWHATWTAYTSERAPIIARLQRGLPIASNIAVDRRLSDHLDAVQDTVLSNAGDQLYTGENVYTQALASEWNTLRVAVLALLLTLAVAAALAAQISGRLTRGLGNLASTASQVTEGAVDARADERGHDEIARLASAFNRMKDALLSAERRAGSDALTGLPNQTTMIASLDREIERARRYNRTCATLFIDVDHFKALNDSYGHPAGDAALIDFAAVVSQAIRGVDLLGRWGGEEFVVVLPETDRAEALRAAERLRAAVAGHRFMVGGGLHLTCSVGVATYPHDGEERNLLIDSADRAMYVAKYLGRNQVRSMDDPAASMLDTTRPGDESRERTAMTGTVEALASLVNARDAYTGQHTEEVAQLSMDIAIALHLDAAEARMIGVAARLHDVGKVAIPDAILQKRGRLTEDEWVLMRSHPSVGADVVQWVPALRGIVPLIRAHHERWDGQGYPEGLAGERIPQGARIIAVADSYSAITTTRPFRQQSESTWAIAELRRCSGLQFDPVVVAALEEVLARRAGSPVESAIPLA